MRLYDLSLYRSLLVPIEVGFDVPFRDSITLKDAGNMHEPNKTSTTLCDIFKRCRTVLKELPLSHDHEHLISLVKYVMRYSLFSWQELSGLIQALLKMRQVCSTISPVPHY